MNITHFEINPDEEQLLKTLDQGANTVKCTEENLTSATAGQANNAEIVTVFVNSVIDQAVFDALPNLKLLVTRSTGYDHIDIAYAQSKGITVCNVPAYGSRTVAEFTFALILNLSRKVFHAIEQIREKGEWDTSKFEGFNLQGKTLGIVGTGRIGLNMAQIAKGFDMKVLAFDAFPNEQKAQAYGFTYAKTLEEVLSNSDIVTLHVPATKDTHHLINSENILTFKKGSILINTSRGDVVDPEAILLGLNKGILHSVGLDVLEGEHELKEEAELMSSNKLNYEKLKTLLDDHILMNHPNVIVTPHIAFNTAEARAEIMTTTLSNIHSFLEGTPQNIVKQI